MGAILAVIFIILCFLFCLWVLMRMASYQSRIEEQYRHRQNKKKKGKK